MKNMIFPVLFLVLSSCFLTYNVVQAKQRIEAKADTDYIVVSRKKGQWAEFEGAVKKQLQNGYKLVGGVSCDGTEMFQALTR